MDWLVQNWVWVLVFVVFIGSSDTEAMAVTAAVVAGAINAPQMESSRARIGRKAIITEEEQSC